MLPKLQPRTDITVDGEKYAVQLYSPTFGLTLYSKLLRLLGEPLVKMVDSFKGKKFAEMDINDLDTDSAAQAMSLLFSKIRDEELPPLLMEILSSTFFMPSLIPIADQFETHFQGQYLHLFKLVGKTLGVQYADFLSGIVKRSRVAKSGLASLQTKANP